MVQEKELLETKIEWLTEELKKKTEELLQTSRVKGEEILELNSSLKSSSQQVTSHSASLLGTKTEQSSSCDFDNWMFLQVTCTIMTNE